MYSQRLVYNRCLRLTVKIQFLLLVTQQICICNVKIDTGRTVDRCYVDIDGGQNGSVKHVSTHQSTCVAVHDRHTICLVRGMYNHNQGRTNIF